MLFYITKKVSAAATGLIMEKCRDAVPDPHESELLDPDQGVKIVL
jgi:hypothetical protein